MEANTGTKPVAESHAFDIGALQPFSKRGSMASKAR